MNIPEGYILVPVEPDDEIIRRMLAVRWPATYRSCLRFQGSGPETSARTESDIFEAKKQYTAAISTISIKPSYDEAKERELFAAEFKLEGKIYFDENTRQWMPVSESIKCFQMAEQTLWCWIGWKSCAKSRARSAE